MVVNGCEWLSVTHIHLVACINVPMRSSSMCIHTLASCTMTCNTALPLSQVLLLLALCIAMVTTSTTSDTSELASLPSMLADFSSTSSTLLIGSSTRLDTNSKSCYVDGIDIVWRDPSRMYLNTGGAGGWRLSDTRWGLVKTVRALQAVLHASIDARKRHDPQIPIVGHLVYRAPPEWLLSWDSSELPDFDIDGIRRVFVQQDTKAFGSQIAAILRQHEELQLAMSLRVSGYVFIFDTLANQHAT
jgi:hypothetical protein